MNKSQTPSLRTPLARTGLAALTVAALLGLAACATGPQAPPPDDSKLFSADWREHTQGMINHGPGISPGTTRWMVPPIIDRGYYRVVERHGQGAELVDGMRVHVDDVINKKVFLFLPIGYSNVELLNEKYITDAKTLADKRGS
jgi:hypothetical protein